VSDPAPARDTAPQQHCAAGIIPMLLCDTRLISCGDTLSLGAATRYELDALILWGETIMTETLAKWQPTALSLLRFMTGLLLFQYAIAKFLKIPVLPYFANLPPLIATAGALELVGGTLLMLGLFTRPVAFILSGQMAFAYFIGHMFKNGIGAPIWHPLVNGGTSPILFCFACLYLATAGGGPYSVDAMMRGKR
jgi:putative oxidoreductase